MWIRVEAHIVKSCAVRSGQTWYRGKTKYRALVLGIDRTYGRVRIFSDLDYNHFDDLDLSQFLTAYHLASDQEPAYSKEENKLIRSKYKQFLANLICRP